MRDEKKQMGSLSSLILHPSSLISHPSFLLPSAGSIRTMAKARMEDLRMDTHEALQREWTDQYVTVNPARPELKRFEGIVGRVVAVNYNNKALIDFQDGGWYDITASAEYLTKVSADVAKAKFDAKANSAQPFPEKQG
jgi:hypothetical protein